MKSKVEKFEDLLVWQERMNLAEIIYKQMNNCKDYGLKDQIQRAVVSIPSNIAEGFDRQSNKEFIRYLYIAKGSTSEVRTQLYICQRLNYLSEKEVNSLIENTKKISSMLYRLIQVRIEKFK